MLNIDEKIQEFETSCHESKLSPQKTTLALQKLTSLELPSMSLDDVLAFHGDKIIGFDNHLIYLVLPGLPPAPLGMMPIPFIGSIKVTEHSHISLGDKKAAYDGIKVTGETFAHKGPIIATVPNVVCERIGPRIMPEIILHACHRKKVYVNNKLVLTAGIAKVSGCKVGKYTIIPKQYFIRMK